MGDRIGEITSLLAEALEGREEALDEVMDLVYRELQEIASAQMRRRYGERASNLTMEPPALVNEAFLRLIKQRKRYDSRGHFFAIATKTMLRVLVDYDRKRLSTKRGGGQTRVSLSGVAGRVEQGQTAVVDDLVGAIERLEALDSRTAEVFKLRVLWGLTVAEIAETTDLSVRTVEREWQFGRRWIAVELGVEEESS